MFLQLIPKSAKITCFFFGAVILISCGAKVATNITSSFTPLDYNENVVVLGVDEPAPTNGSTCGTIKIGDSGLSTNCSFDVVIAKAMDEARKAGCNVVKLTEHKPPGFGSSCDRITATLYRIDQADIAKGAKEDKPNPDWDYAMLYVFRPNGVGALVGYDVYLGDSVIWRAKNNSKAEIKIRKKGMNSIWAKTESKVEVPIDIEFGREYYLRCSMSMGVMVGRPALLLVNKVNGRPSYEAVKPK